MSNRQSSRVWMTLSSLLKNKSTGRQICDVVYNETLDPLSMPSAWDKVLLHCGLARQGGTSRGLQRVWRGRQYKTSGEYPFQLAQHL